LDIKSILILALVCASGAISPGPSLAVVMKNTIKGGRSQGVMTGIGHGLGLTIYAFIAVMGLSSMLLGNQLLFICVQMGGAFWLIYIGYNMIIFSSKGLSGNNGEGVRKGFVEGFMISFLNPKILVFFVAVFSQFIHEELTSADRTIIVMVAGAIDTFWYVLVAVVLARSRLIDKIKENSVWIDRATGILLIVISLSIIIKILDFKI
tara:strand:+ start:196 stop:816 length:621 start_codon:yes stop_codon:yes gene_type:complete